MKFQKIRSGKYECGKYLIYRAVPPYNRWWHLYEASNKVFDGTNVRIYHGIFKSCKEAMEQAEKLKKNLTTKVKRIG